MRAKLSASEAEILQSEFFTDCLETIGPALLSIERIVCLGLGKFTECSTARYQLAFIRCLRDKFLPGLRGQFFDPVFGPSEIEALLSLDETVLQENLEGKYCAERRTLFYLPHCPKQIVNNVLWSNWQSDRLGNVTLISNSFASIVNNNPHRLLQTSAGYIVRAADFFDEVPLKNTFRFSDIFNDTSLHHLPLGATFPAGIWDNSEEPAYDTDDLELISKELVRQLVLSTKEKL
ncbi:SRR1-like protein [Anopheles bellator]|uniref:SRR1-like protein n=1 Tax=Anopheles bellator TaxID=139047 RepID=UPI002647B6EC|nr:SRR1-like protein [Anopheles bellator]